MPTTQELQQEIDRLLPRLANQSEEVIKARLGEAEQRARGMPPEGLSSEQLAEFGERFLQRKAERFKEAICSAYARKEIAEALTPQNVLAVATLLLAVVGATVAVPTVVATLAILIIKIGLNDFCKDYPIPPG